MTTIWKSVEVAIVGGGVGGIASALWCHRLALDSILLEKSHRLGGQLHHIHNLIPDYPGILCDGATLASHLEDQLAQLDIIPCLDTIVQKADLEQKILVTNHGNIRAKAIIAATGAIRRKLQVPGVERLLGKGVEYTFSGSRHTFCGHPVCIIGGGDGAFENALMMAETCPHITIVMRKRTPRARQDFVKAAKAHTRITILQETIVESIEGNEKVEAIFVKNAQGQYRIEVGAVLIKIGLAPALDWLDGSCECAEVGTLQASLNQRTSHPLVWSVGDICTPQDPSISVAVGQACLAVREIQRLLLSESQESQESQESKESIT